MSLVQPPERLQIGILHTDLLGLPLQATSNTHTTVILVLSGEIISILG